MQLQGVGAGLLGSMWSAKGKGDKVYMYLLSH